MFCFLPPIHEEDLLKKTNCIPVQNPPPQAQLGVGCKQRCLLPWHYLVTNLSRYSDKAACKDSWPMPVQKFLSFSPLTLTSSPSGNTEISLSLFTLRFSEAVMVSCSGTVLFPCFPLPFAEQHGMAVHLFMIYFTQWLGPDYTDRHSRLFEGQLDLCNDTQTVPKPWGHFQTKNGQWKNSTRISPRRPFLSLIPGSKNKNLIFLSGILLQLSVSKWITKTKEKTRREIETWVFLAFKYAYWRRDYE